MKQSGVDKYGLPLCGNKSQEKIRQSAMSKYNKIIKKENINIEKAEELRFYHLPRKTTSFRAWIQGAKKCNFLNTNK